MSLPSTDTILWHSAALRNHPNTPKQFPRKTQLWPRGRERGWGGGVRATSEPAGPDWKG